MAKKVKLVPFNPIRNAMLGWDNPQCYVGPDLGTNGSAYVDTVYEKPDPFTATLKLRADLWVRHERAIHLEDSQTGRGYVMLCRYLPELIASATIMDGVVQGDWMFWSYGKRHSIRLVNAKKVEYVHMWS